MLHILLGASYTTKGGSSEMDLAQSIPVHV